MNQRGGKKMECWRHWLMRTHATTATACAHSAEFLFNVNKNCNYEVGTRDDWNDTFLAVTSKYLIYVQVFPNDKKWTKNGYLHGHEVKLVWEMTINRVIVAHRCRVHRVLIFSALYVFIALFYDKITIFLWFFK